MIVKSNRSFIGVIGTALILAYSITSTAVAVDYIKESNGYLSFPADASGYKIPDFSYAGYRRGEVSLPEHGVHYSTKRSLTNPSGDETSRIQQAIQDVSAMPLNEHGYRGAVTLGPGQWNVTSLDISVGGVVLRGSGKSETIIQCTTSGGNVINLGAASSTNSPSDIWQEGRSGQRWNITTSTVNVGDMIFAVETGHELRVGDRIVIDHPCTQAWINAVDGGGVTADAPWTAGLVPIRYYRYVTEVSGNTITIDAPVMYSLNRSISQSFVYKYTATTYQNLGVENLTVDASRETNTLADGPINDCLRFNRVENSWVRNFRGRNYQRSAVYLGESSRMTIENSEANDPHSVVMGSRRYGFNHRGGQLVVYKDCYGRRNRHTFITNGWGMDSGNVYLNCVAEDNYAAVEHGHQKWANGSLFDNCIFRHVGTPESGESFNEFMLWLGNHGDNADGHGWGAVSAVVYGCDVQSPGHAIVAKPPTGMNWVIGSTGDFRSRHSGHGDYPGALNITTSGRMPVSLYTAQLAQRLGVPDVLGIEADYTSVDFGYRPINSNSDFVVTLTNKSSKPVSGSVGESSSQFSVLSGATFTSLPVNGTHQVVARFTPSSAGLHSTTLNVTGDVALEIALSGTAVALQGGLAFSAEQGTLFGAMSKYNGYIATPVKDEGRAVYAVVIPAPGEYKIVTEIDASSGGSNSFLVNFDSSPTDPIHTWDVVQLTSGFESREVTLRGANGTYDVPEFQPATWTLGAGVHYLIVDGRESDTRLKSLALTLIGGSPNPEDAVPAQPTDLRVEENK